jgi:aminoglycoside phosphotransferase (APT) family kinase protein
MSSTEGNDKIINNNEGMNNFTDIKKIVEKQVGSILSLKKMPGGSNEVYFLEAENGKYITKIYNEKISQRTNLSREIQISNLLKDLPEIRKMLFSDTSKEKIPHEFAIFEYVDGQTLRSLIESGSIDERRLEDIARQVYLLIARISSVPTEGFGQLDETGLRGTSKTWVEFLKSMQNPTTTTFSSSSTLPAALYLAPQRILNKHKDKFLLQEPRLIPMDLNTDNIIVTKDNKIIFIDPETFWSGDSLCSYAQFYALTKGTILGESFKKRLPASSEDEFKIRFYALLDNLNVLAYITRVDPRNTMVATPWGNPHKFVDLIKDHVDYLETK